MKNIIDTKKCPFCGMDNNCQAGQNDACWCVNIKFPQELLDLVPEQYKGKSCICLPCVELFKANKNEFVKRFVQK